MVKETHKMDVELIKKFAKFCQKRLGIKKLPKIKLTQSRDEIKTTAGYKRGKEVIVYTKGRHKVDVCRSIAHELKHHKQWEDQDFNDTEVIQDVGGKFEDEANAAAGQMIKQFAYAGNMNIYESHQLLREGRVEDAKKQFPSISDKLIDYISSIDPSGNNKYLRWVLKQLRSKMITTPELDQKSFIDQIIPIITEFNNLLPYYSSKYLDANLLDNKIIQAPKDINNYGNIEQLTLANDMIRPILTKKQNERDQLRSSESLYDGTDYLVVRIRTHKEMCYYGNQTRWCVDNQTGQSKFANDITTYYIFVIWNKDDNAPFGQKKFIVLLSKVPNIRQNIKIFTEDDHIITLKELNELNPRFNDFIRLMEIWAETNTERSTISIKSEHPELFVLSQYLNDDNLRHYKLNPSDEFAHYTYNNGKIVEQYYVGDPDVLKRVVQEFYFKQHQQNPKLLLRHPELLTQILKMQDLFRLALHDLSFDAVFIDPEKIKPYYAVPPVKLKTANIVNNKSDLQQLSQLDNEMMAHDQALKTLNKTIQATNRKIKQLGKLLDDQHNRLGVLKIRAEQVKSDAIKYNNIQHKINEYSRVIELNGNEQIQHIQLKNQLEKNAKSLQIKYNNLSDEYAEMINQIELTYGDKVNYEYSHEQLNDAKDKIKRNIISNPVDWIKKLKLTPAQLIELVDLNKLSEILYNQMATNIKSFGPYKLVNSRELNKTPYYIFVYETPAVSRK